MFKKVAADALGLSDIGSVISPKDYDKVEADDYVMHEEEEKIFFLIKSKMDEYCFTNKALIHVDGTSAISKKRMLRRYSYYKHPITNVALETAGTIDMDIEIKFSMGDKAYSIDVHKQYLEQLKDLYKALYKMSSIQKENMLMHDYSMKSLSAATNSVARSSGATNPEDQFKEINQYAFKWMEHNYKTYVRKDFSEVFLKFINN
ncbi:MAG: PH domain-containing protein [Chloroflexota bacterium]